MNKPRVPVERVVEYLRKHMTLSNAELIERLGCSPNAVTRARRELDMLPKGRDQQASDALDDAQEQVMSGVDLSEAVAAVVAEYNLNTEQRYRVRKNLVVRMQRLSNGSKSSNTGSLVPEMMAGEMSMIWQRRAWR